MIPHNTYDVQNAISFGTINRFRYTNHRGETADRRVIPCCLRFGSTEYYPEPQWLLECIDLDKLQEGGYRTFALKNIEPR